MLSSASKSSIRRFIITEKAPTRCGIGTLTQKSHRTVGLVIIVSLSLYSILNVKAVVAAFNQEKALGAFSVITNLWMDLRLNRYCVAVAVCFNKCHQKTNIQPNETHI